MRNPLLDQFAEAWTAFAKSLSPHDIHKMKHDGLNRANRRKMMSLARKGKLTYFDIPLWILMRHVSGNLTA